MGFNGIFALFTVIELEIQYATEMTLKSLVSVRRTAFSIEKKKDYFFVKSHN